MNCQLSQFLKCTRCSCLQAHLCTLLLQCVANHTVAKYSNSWKQYPVIHNKTDFLTFSNEFWSVASLNNFTCMHDWTHYYVILCLFTITRNELGTSVKMQLNLTAKHKTTVLKLRDILLMPTLKITQDYTGLLENICYE